jgi:hypothetical protein
MELAPYSLTWLDDLERLFEGGRTFRIRSHYTRSSMAGEAYRCPLAALIV